MKTKTNKIKFFSVIALITLVMLSTQGKSQPTYDISRTISDQAQRQTIAFAGLAFITGDRCADSFLPPGKVADFCGFQYFRDNDPTGLGHSGNFVTIIAFNMLNLLDTNQLNQLISLADDQIAMISDFGYNRFPLIDAFRRYYENDTPPSLPELCKDSVVEYSAQLYLLDGQISYKRTKVMGDILRNMSPAQIVTLDSLIALNGVGNWPDTLSNPLQALNLSQPVNVAVMTYASEMYSWYAGSIEADVYFCPERQGTYFGSFYMKDIRAMQNPNIQIDPNMTADMGQEFLDALDSTTQAKYITCLVDSQRTSLFAIVDVREEIATHLRGFLDTNIVDSAAVMVLAEEYGRLDGTISWFMATHFSEVGQSLISAQFDTLMAVRDLDNFPCNGAYLYSEPIPMPNIPNTDNFFTGSLSVVVNNSSESKLNVFPNPFSCSTQIVFTVSNDEYVQIKIYDMMGRDVKTLANNEYQTGNYQIIWDGTDYSGNSLGQGVYLCNIMCSTERTSLLILKE